MGKKKAQDIDDDFEDELDNEQTASKGNSGPIPVKKLEKYANSVAALKAQMDEIRGELGAEVKQFEEEGGHKLAFKLALKLKSMETIKAQDLWRSLEQYCHDLGIFDQHDLFDPVSAKEAAPKKTNRKPAAELSQQPAGNA